MAYLQTTLTYSEASYPIVVNCYSHHAVVNCYSHHYMAHIGCEYVIGVILYRCQSWPPGFWIITFILKTVYTLFYSHNQTQKKKAPKKRFKKQQEKRKNKQNPTLWPVNFFNSLIYCGQFIILFRIKKCIRIWFKFLVKMGQLWMTQQRT